jgi:glycerophosphoryl diester phosphodiesterase
VKPLPLAGWPYPFWIAHGGAGLLAPENTLAAFKLGAAHGFRMFECDAKLSADSVPFLLHDATLERTTDGHGIAGEQLWQALALLDAGSWHSPAFAGVGLATLEAAARFCLEPGRRRCLNIEIKPTPGQEAITGTVVAQRAAMFWKNAAQFPSGAQTPDPGSPPPLLSSFQRASLAAARDAQPQLPRALLLDRLPPDWLDAARALQCVAIVAKHTLWTPASAAAAKAAGFRLLAYTVNDQASADRLVALGLDGIITDRVDLFVPD